MISTVFLFASTYVEMVQVDLKKKVLLVHITVAIDPGTIVRGELKNKEAIQLLLVEMRKKMVAPDDHVVVVVPEDSVISKSVELPKLREKEIDEAVRWEAEGFLPYPLQDAVLDWKVLSMDDVSHVLFQALPKAIVESYVEVFDWLGLELAAIETPALALVRLAENQPGVRILIHVSNGDTVITLAKDKEVLATSVVNRSENYGANIVKTVQHMMQYYKKFEVQWLQVGGIGVSSELVEALKKLGVNVEGFSLPFTIKADVANQYLIALSASLKVLSPPSDSKTINLLPDVYVRKYMRKHQGSFWTKMLTVNLVLFFLVFAALLGVFMWLSTQEKILLVQQESTPPVEKQAIEQANQANSLAQLVLTVSKTDFFPVDLLNRIRSLNEGSIQVASLSVHLSEKSGEFSGLAKDRVSMLAFKQALEEMDEIGQVFLPISSFTAEKDILFQMKFTIKDEFLEKPLESHTEKENT